MKTTTLTIGFALALMVGVGCKDKDKTAEPAQETKETKEASAAVEAAAKPAGPAELRERIKGLIEPIPASVEVNEKKAELGRALYHDTRLSADGTVSCASCHGVADGGDDGKPTSLGIKDQLGPINSPTVLNASFNFVQFWDGRAPTLEEQAKGPVENPLEMGHQWDKLVEEIKADEAYAKAFEALYEDGVTVDNAAHAIAEFERTLITPNSPFDKFLQGDDEALSEQALAGLGAFVDTGCTSCHMGRNLGGTMYQKMGLVHDYFKARGGEVTEADLGRFNVTKEEKDRHFFKVPTLRNVELTAPYMHDGKTETLEEAVKQMAWHQLGRELDDETTANLVAFMKSLTGEIPEVDTDPTLKL